MNRVLILALAILIATPCTRTPAFARAMESGDAAVAQKTMPAVVNISTWRVKQPEQPGGSPRRVKTYGSGFIIDPSGIIVTNKHVIDGSIDIKVIFDNGDRVTGKLLAVAAMIDLAVLKVDAGRPLPALKWGDSENLHVGDAVLAIGNPLGLGESVSSGIVSALNRDIQDTPFDNYIQTDAAINHGNSGGPLVDLNGDVIGVNTALYNPEESGGFIGIGFAMPAGTSKFVVDRLLDPSHPKPGWLGLTLQDLTQELSQALGMREAKGSIISAVDAGGPASAVGLRPGDILMAVDDARPTDPRAFMRAIVEIPVGQPAQLTVWRDGKEQAVTATVAEWPNFMPGGGVMSAQAAEAMIQKLPDPGVRLAPLTDAARKQFGIDAKVTGVLVASVEADCEARDLGIVAGDVVTAVQGAPVATPEEVRRAVQAAHQQQRPFLAVLLRGKSTTRWVSLSMGGPGS
jgi:serine protease Do